MDILLLTCGIIDYKYRKIPNLIIYIIFGWALFFSSVPSLERIAGFLVTAVPLFILALTTGKIKGGDYKFLVACAAALGIGAFIKSLTFAVITAMGWRLIKREKNVPLAFAFMVGYVIFYIFKEVFV